MTASFPLDNASNWEPVGLLMIILLAMTSVKSENLSFLHRGISHNYTILISKYCGKMSYALVMNRPI